MTGTMMPIMCQILVVTQLNKKDDVYYYLRCFTDMALHSRDAVTFSAAVATRSCADCSSMEGHTSLSTALVLVWPTSSPATDRYLLINPNGVSFRHGWAAGLGYHR